MKKPVQKNDIINVIIEDITHLGYGVAKVNNFSVFVENALPKEFVKIRIERVERRFAFGKLLEIYEASEDRIEVEETLETHLGTMPLLHMNYPAQLNYKLKVVKEALARHIDIESINFFNTIGMDKPFYYRNKAQIPVREIDQVLETGFFKRGSRDLIPAEDFYIQDKDIDQAIVMIRDILRDYQIKAYNEKTHQGLVRHLIVRKGHQTQELMVIFVLNGDVLPYHEHITQEILTKLPNVVSVVLNVNTQKTNVIMGDKQTVLFGEDAYYDKLGDLTFAISSKSFYQVNSIQTEKLYRKAIEFAEISKNDVVIDAFCGIGTITLFAAQYAKHVYGVEIVEDAITMARKNQKMNQINNVTFEVGKAESVITKWVQDGLKADVLIVDPPRKGLEASFIQDSIKTQPNRIVYISCNPQTLGRDLKLYQEYGYKVKRVQAIDMFPHTTHVECIALIQKEII